MSRALLLHLPDRLPRTGCTALLLFCLCIPAIAQHSAPVPEAPAPQTTLATAPLQTTPGASTTPTSPEPGSISLYSVVDLALRNSRAVQVAQAERAHAHGTLLEMRDAYIPNFSLGSGLGYSYGFPLGNPTLFNVNSTSLLFSFSQRHYINAARAGLKAATLALKNVRRQVILDASLNYIELSKTLEQIQALNQAADAADRMVSVVQDRVNAGVESGVDLTQAQLTRARIRLRSMQMEDHAQELRKHLGDMAGLPADSITPAASSIPALPDLDFHSLMEQSAKSPAVQASFATAESRRSSALGDKNQNYRPTVGMAFQYARFAPFNGYSNYYRNFTYNNIGLGIQAVWPLFDPIRRDKAMESKAEAARALHQAQLDKIQNDESNLAQWHGLQELELQQEIAGLQEKLAQATLETAVTRMNGGPVAAGTAPVAPQQADQYRLQERTSFVDFEDAEFSVTKAKLNLLSAIGGIEDWAKQSTPEAGSHIKGFLRH